MATTEMDYSASGGGVSETPERIYAPSGSNVNMSGTGISVTSGKTYVAVGITNAERSHSYTVTGGEVLGTFVSQGNSYWLYSTDKSVSTALVIKATADTLTIVDSYGYLYAGQLIQLD